MSRSLQRVILERAIAILESSFTKHAWARDKERAPVPWWSKNAVRFCAESAIRKATRETLGSYGNRGARLAQTLIVRCCCVNPRANVYLAGSGVYLQYVNDCRGRTAVLRLMRMAVELM